VGDLEATVGISQAEIENKVATKVEMDRALRPFRIIAAAWAGGVMLGAKKCDDFGYAELLKSVAETGDLPEHLPSPSGRGAGGEGSSGDDQHDGGLPAMIARGLGIQLPSPNGRGAGGEGNWTRDGLYALLESGRCVPALSFDLTFPEVFYPNGVPYQRQGFDAVLSNPPWEAIQFKSKEFFAAFDFEILNAPTKRERTVIENRLTADPSCGPVFEHYVEDFEQQKRMNDCLYQHQKVFIDGDLAGRQLDAFRVFMERNAQVLQRAGITGVVVPSAFHANEGATGIRQLYLEKMTLRCCYSFENRRKLFEIDSRFKFALVVAAAGATTEDFACAFYLHDDDWLFQDRKTVPSLTYSIDFVRSTGGHYLNLVEVRSAESAATLHTLYTGKPPFSSLCETIAVFVQGPPAALHMSHESHRFADASSIAGRCDPREMLKGVVPLHHLVLFEGKYFWHYDDQWGDAPRYVIPLSAMVDLGHHLKRACQYQFALRKIAASTNERTIVGCLLPPGVAVGDSGLVNSTVRQARNSDLLMLLAVVNSHVFDWLARQQVGSNVTLFVLRGLPVPAGALPRRFTEHAALRLQSNHSGYEPLWREQVGEAWREEGKPPMTWPVLAGDDERWAVRAAIDAVVADAYGLSRDQYAHVLSTFSHASYRKAPELCLARFDELKTLGLEKFTRKYDPYWDIPLNENLPQPVIDLPIPGEAKEEDDGNYRLTGAAKPAKRGRKKK
jgi:hypothetical protein